MTMEEVINGIREKCGGSLLGSWWIYLKLWREPASGSQQKMECTPDGSSREFGEGVRHRAQGKLRKQQGLLLKQWEAIISWGQKGKQRKQCRAHESWSSGTWLKLGTWHWPREWVRKKCPNLSLFLPASLLPIPPTDWVQPESRG